MAETIDWHERARQVADAIACHAAVHDANDSFVTEGFAALEGTWLLQGAGPWRTRRRRRRHRRDMCGDPRPWRSRGSTALAFSMHSHVVAVAAWRWSHQAAPTDALLKRIASEDLIMASSGGSDWLQSGGTAERAEGGFEITARKGFSSGSPNADLLATSAGYDDPQAGPTVLHFALPLKGEGVTHLPTWQVMGMRGTGSNDLEVERLFVPDSGIVGRRPKGPGTCCSMSSASSPSR